MNGTALLPEMMEAPEDVLRDDLVRGNCGARAAGSCHETRDSTPPVDFGFGAGLPIV